MCIRGLGKYELQFVNIKKTIDLFFATEIVTFQNNLPGLRYTWASGPEACGCRSGRSLLVASVANPEQPVSLPHYCENPFPPKYGPGVDSVSNRNEYQKNLLGEMRPVRKADNLTTSLCRRHEM